MEKEKTNKISIYLLKEGISIKEVLEEKEGTPYSEKELRNNIFYYAASKAFTPSWKKKFFNDELNKLPLSNQSTKGVYFVKISIQNNQERFFAVTFGYGHTMINKTHCVDDFGLKVVLNAVDKDSIRKVSKRALSSDPKNTIEQLGKRGNISYFGIDIEQDLVEEITGKLKENSCLGKNNITGKLAALTVSAKVNISTIEEFLKQTFECYKKEDYKKDFPFIDNFKAIKDVNKWDNKLLDKLKGNSSENIKLWMSIPEIIEWEDIKGFSYNGKKDENIVDDIDLESFKGSLSDTKQQPLNLKKLKNKKITAFRNSTDTEYDSWSYYKCLYCEITKKDKTVILANGKWYEVACNFVKDIQDGYNKIINNPESAQINFIECDEKEHEDKYNERLKNNIDGSILMDRKNINYNSLSSVELCDIYDKNKKRFIHVKNYYGSSALSHLFAQGMVSGELFLSDKKFRQEAQKKEESLGFTDDRPTASEYEIVFGIINKSKNELDLPFFSKVNLRHAQKRLNSFNFKSVYLIKIQRKNGTH